MGLVKRVGLLPFEYGAKAAGIAGAYGALTSKTIGIDGKIVDGVRTIGETVRNIPYLHEILRDMGEPAYKFGTKYAGKGIQSLETLAQDLNILYNNMTNDTLDTVGAAATLLATLYLIGLGIRLHRTEGKGNILNQQLRKFGKRLYGWNDN